MRICNVWRTRGNTKMILEAAEDSHLLRGGEGLLEEYTYKGGPETDTGTLGLQQLEPARLRQL